MSSILRAAAVYLVLLVVFRVAGKRTLSDMTTFDLVLVLIISEAVQTALVDTDNSMTNAFLLVITLVGIDVLLSVLKHRFPSFGRSLDVIPWCWSATANCSRTWPPRSVSIAMMC